MKTTQGNSKKLFIGVPIYHNVDPHYHACMGELRQCNQANGITIYEHVGDSLVSRARNHITRKFLESDCTDLLFIDSDLVFDLRQIQRIMSHDEDMVAGIYFKKSEGSPQMVNNLFPQVQFQENGLMEGKYAGTGFLRIKRRVFELMIQEFGKDIWYMLDPDHKQKEYDFWHCGRYIYPDGLVRYLSEDWWFCQRWLDIGGKLWIDRNIVLKHSGNAIYPLSYQEQVIFNRPTVPVVGEAVEQPTGDSPAVGELSVT